MAVDESQEPVLGSPQPLIPAGLDVDEAVAFYERLGFALTFKTGDPTEIARVKRGQAELLLQRNDDEHLMKETVVRIPVHENIEQLNEEYQALNIWKEYQNARLVKLRMKAWGLREIHLIDLSRVLIQFFEPRKS